MRVSELIGTQVVDRDGHRLGRVRDLRVIQDGPQHATGQAALQLRGLVAGRFAIGTRLGYAAGSVDDDRNGIRGPWLIRALVRRLHRQAQYVDWDDIVSIEDSHIVVSDSRPVFDARSR